MLRLLELCREGPEERLPELLLREEPQEELPEPELQLELPEDQEL